MSKEFAKYSSTGFGQVNQPNRLLIADDNSQASTVERHSYQVLLAQQFNQGQFSVPVGVPLRICRHRPRACRIRSRRAVNSATSSHYILRVTPELTLIFAGSGSLDPCQVDRTHSQFSQKRRWARVIGNALPGNGDVRAEGTGADGSEHAPKGKQARRPVQRVGHRAEPNSERAG